MAAILTPVYLEAIVDRLGMQEARFQVDVVFRANPSLAGSPCPCACCLAACSQIASCMPAQPIRASKACACGLWRARRRSRRKDELEGWKLFKHTCTHRREARADEARDWCWLVVRTARNKRHGASRDEPFHACFEVARAFFKQQDGSSSSNNNNNNNKDFLRRR